jgi:transcriptional regulator with XRE-family HTH domain
MLSDFVRAQRHRHNLSLSQLAERVGCSKAHLHDIEMGRTANPTLDFICDLAAAVGVSAVQVVRAALAGDRTEGG